MKATSGYKSYSYKAQAERSVGLTMEVTLIYSYIGKSGANPSKNIFEKKKIGKIGQYPLDPGSDL